VPQPVSIATAITPITSMPMIFFTTKISFHLGT
jgi:hypothetical protein